MSMSNEPSSSNENVSGILIVGVSLTEDTVIISSSDTDELFTDSISVKVRTSEPCQFPAAPKVTVISETLANIF